MLLSFAGLPSWLLATQLIAAPAAPLLPSSAVSTAADTVRHPPHLVKLGLHGSTAYLAYLPQLRYERQLKPQWSLQVGAGYRRHYDSQGFDKRNRFSTYGVNVDVRRYSGTRGPLRGIYAGVGLASSTIFLRTQTKVYQPYNLSYTSNTENTRSTLVEARSQVGFQVNPGSKVALDAYLGFGVACRLTTADTQRLFPTVGLGCALGYRL